jgi:hypothetical protein
MARRFAPDELPKQLNDLFLAFSQVAAQALHHRTNIVHRAGIVAIVSGASNADSWQWFSPRTVHRTVELAALTGKVKD